MIRKEYGIQCMRCCPKFIQWKSAIFSNLLFTFKPQFKFLFICVPCFQRIYVTDDSSKAALCYSFVFVDYRLCSVIVSSLFFYLPFIYFYLFFLFLICFWLDLVFTVVWLFGVPLLDFFLLRYLTPQGSSGVTIRSYLFTIGLIRDFVCFLWCFIDGLGKYKEGNDQELIQSEVGRKNLRN